MKQMTMTSTASAWTGNNVQMKCNGSSATNHYAVGGAYDTTTYGFSVWDNNSILKYSGPTDAHPTAFSRDFNIVRRIGTVLLWAYHLYDSSTTTSTTYVQVTTDGGSNWTEYSGTGADAAPLDVVYDGSSTYYLISVATNGDIVIQDVTDLGNTVSVITTGGEEYWAQGFMYDAKYYFLFNDTAGNGDAYAGGTIGNRVYPAFDGGSTATCLCTWDSSMSTGDYTQIEEMDDGNVCGLCYTSALIQHYDTLFLVNNEDGELYRCKETWEKILEADDNFCVAMSAGGEYINYITKSKSGYGNLYKVRKGGALTQISEPKSYTGTIGLWLERTPWALSTAGSRFNAGLYASFDTGGNDWYYETLTSTSVSDPTISVEQMKNSIMYCNDYENELDTTTDNWLYLYDTNDNFVFYGLIDDYDSNPSAPRKVYYTTYFSNDLNVKFSKDFTDQTVAEMVNYVIPRYCKWLYPTTITADAGTYSKSFKNSNVQYFLTWLHEVCGVIVTWDFEGEMRIDDGSTATGTTFSLANDNINGLVQVRRETGKYGRVYVEGAMQADGTYLYAIAKDVDALNDSEIRFYYHTESDIAKLQAIADDRLAMRHKQIEFVDLPSNNFGIPDNGKTYVITYAPESLTGNHICVGYKQTFYGDYHTTNIYTVNSIIIVSDQTNMDNNEESIQSIIQGDSYIQTINLANDPTTDDNVGNRAYNDARYLKNSAIRATRSTTQSIANATATKVVFLNEIYDVNSDYDPATGLFTAPVTGRYHIECLCTFDTTTWTDGEIAFIDIYINAASYCRLNTITNQASQAMYLAINGSTDIEMTAADTCHIVIYQTTGAALNILANASTNWFTVHELN